MSNNFSDSIVLVTSKAQENTSLGTGFVVFQDKNQGLTYLLTCAHVVDAVGGKEQVKAANFPAKVVASGEAKEIDLAVLQVEGLLDKLPLRLCIASGEGKPFVIIGYYKFSGKKAFRKLSGTLGSQFGFSSNDNSQNFNAWDLKIISDEHYLEPGYSGSPVIDQANNGLVLGVVSDRTGNGDKGVAISIEALKEVWKEMPRNLISSPPSPVSPPVSPYDSRYETIIDAFSFGIDTGIYSGVIPFLGAGVNLCGPLPISPIEIASKLAMLNSENLIGVPCSICPIKLKQWSREEWSIPQECPILKQIIADTTEGQSIDPRNCELSNEQRLALAKINLRLLSQYYRLTSGGSDSEKLYKKIHQLFDKGVSDESIFDENQYTYNRVHHFLATLPRTMKRKGYGIPYQLILTTNYDDRLERAFKYEDQDFDLIYYVAEGEGRGQFRHQTYDEFCNKEKGQIINTSDYETNRPLPWGKRPIILKLYGTWTDKFVITEDHHINYLSSYSVSNILPIKLLSAITDANNRILLLGYSLSDFDLELVLHRFSEAENKLKGDFFIVHQSKAGSLENELWAKRGVGNNQCIRSSLKDCINQLEKGIEKLPHK
jgi:hypothetical protein